TSWVLFIQKFARRSQGTKTFDLNQNFEPRARNRRPTGVGAALRCRSAGCLLSDYQGAAMNPAKGRRKFTPQVIEKIKEFVAEGISREEIASRVGVTVGSLQVTCSKLGISLRRIILPNGSGRHVRIAHVGEQKEVSQPEAKFAITMRYRGKEQ